MAALHNIASGLVLLVLITGLASALRPGQVLDMTYRIDNTTLGWAGAPYTFEQIIIVRNVTDTSPWLEMNAFTTAEHYATHLDAPSHLAKGKWRLHEIPIENFVGPAVRVDVSVKALANPDYQISVEDLTSWESQNGPIPDGALLFFFTGYGVYWPNREKYFGYAGVDKSIENGVSLLHFPGISQDAATWLVKNTEIKGVGIDTPSLDYGGSLGYESHQIILEKNIYGLENVANMHLLPTTGATVYALPIYMKDGSGSPVRIIAVGDSGGAVLRAGLAVFLLVGIALLLK